MLRSNAPRWLLEIKKALPFCGCATKYYLGRGLRLMYVMYCCVRERLTELR